MTKQSKAPKRCPLLQIPIRAHHPQIKYHLELPILQCLIRCHDAASKSLPIPPHHRHHISRNLSSISSYLFMLLPAFSAAAFLVAAISAAASFAFAAAPPCGPLQIPLLLPPLLSLLVAPYEFLYDCLLCCCPLFFWLPY